MDPPAVTNNVVQRKTEMAAVVAATMTDPATADGTNGARGCDAVLNFATSVPSAKRAAKRWKERQASSRNTAGIKSSTVPLMLANSLMSPGSSFVLCDSQCVVEISAPVGVVTAEPALQPQPVFKRRCSLTMPYPALYGSWQVQTASPANPPPAASSKAEKAQRPTSTYDSPLTERKSLARRAERTLQRRWSTFQMNVDHLQLAPQDSTSPSSPPGLSVPMTGRRSCGSSGRARSGDVSATIDEQTEGENETALSDNVDSDARRIAEIPRTLNLSGQRFNNGNPRRTSVDNETSPSVISSYLGEDSCHQLSAIHLQENLEQPETARPLIANDDEEDDEEEDEDLHLITCTLQRLPLKDFGAEVRPAVDITQFLQQSVLLLDVTENSPSDLVDLLLSKMVPSVAEEAKMILFTHDTGTSQRKNHFSYFFFFLHSIGAVFPKKCRIYADEIGVPSPTLSSYGRGKKGKGGESYSSVPYFVGIKFKMLHWAPFTSSSLERLRYAIQSAIAPFPHVPVDLSSL